MNPGTKVNHLKSTDLIQVIDFIRVSEKNPNKMHFRTKEDAAKYLTKQLGFTVTAANVTNIQKMVGDSSRFWIQSVAIKNGQIQSPSTTKDRLDRMERILSQVVERMSELGFEFDHMEESKIDG